MAKTYAKKMTQTFDISDLGLVQNLPVELLGRPEVLEIMFEEYSATLTSTR